MPPKRYCSWRFASGWVVGGLLVPKKVLLVEDREDIRGMMAVYLTLKQFEVVEAVNGYEAVQLALQHKPDVILMDIAMPVLDGIDSTRTMRNNRELADIPILCLTAFGDFYEERAKSAGCDEVLQKPIDFNRLDDLLDQYVDPEPRISRSTATGGQ